MPAFPKEMHIFVYLLSGGLVTKTKVVFSIFMKENTSRFAGNFNFMGCLVYYSLIIFCGPSLTLQKANNVITLVDENFEISL